MRRRMRVAVGLVAACWIGVAAAQAAPVNCPDLGGERECALSVGGTDFVVHASDLGGGLFTVDTWTVSGVPQLGLLGFTFRDFTTVGGVTAVLEQATLDTATSTIFVQFREDGGPLTVGVEFHVSGAPNTSTVDEVITLSATSEVDTRLYVIKDFDLSGSAIDTRVIADASGTPITQWDKNSNVEVAVFSGRAPDGFELGPCCALVDDFIFGSDTYDLNNNTTTAGNRDLQTALSWDEVIPAAGSFSVTLRSTMTVPEPPGGAGEALAAAALCAIAAARRPTRRVGRRAASRRRAKLTS